MHIDACGAAPPTGLSEGHGVDTSGMLRRNPAMTGTEVTRGPLGL